MKKILSFFLMSAPVLLFAQEQPFTITGKAPAIKGPAKVYLNYRAGDTNVMDSAVINNGTFSFTGNVQGPTMARIILDHTGAGLAALGRTADTKVLYLANEKVTVNVKDSVNNATIAGSAINKEHDLYQKSLEAPQKTMEAINEEYMAATPEKRKEEAFMKGLQDRYAKAADEEKELQKKYMAAHPGSYFSLEALTQMAGPDMDLAVVEPLFNTLSPELQKSSKGVAFAKLMDAAKATQVGAVAPEFVQNDVNDKPVKLSDFRGKYVLLDFWASWCGPCRQENPNVVAAYNKYKDKNFTVLGISLDQPGKKDAWLKAIEKDGRAWTQVSDLKFWNNEVAALYGVRAIPQNYLLDPTGKIVAKNLRGEKLHETLEQLVK
jgi:peroxiredoxin